MINFLKILLALMIALQPIAGYAQALPEGMVASEGVTLNTDDPNVLIVNAPDHATIDWDSFSIGADQSVRFILPNETSSILNRVVGGSATDIWGALYSNGNVFLVNTAGINFHANAVIDTASLIASTLDISKENFSAGSYVFEKSLSSQMGKILNEANFSAKNIVFIAEQIENRGVLEANLGRVILSSGAKQTLSFDGQGLINVVVDEGAAEALIENSGTLRANGGKIMLTAKDLNNTLDTLINNTGVIEATRMEEVDGVIEFLSDDDGGIHSSGIIWGSELHESGYTFKSTGVLEVMQAYYDNIDGAIDLSGSISGVHSDTGNINFTGAITLTGDTTLAADTDTDEVGRIIMNTFGITGGNFNLTLTTGEDNTLDGSITGVNLLTLNSSTVNDKTFTSTSADGTFSVTTLDTNYHSLFSRDETDGTDHLIFSVSNVVGGLQYIDTNATTLGYNYKMANNIDATETASWNAGAGFNPIGDNANSFTGDFEGDNKTISNLFINRPTTDYIGLFAQTNAATIDNLVLSDADITGQLATGGLIGWSTGSSFDNLAVSGSVTGTDYSGGVIGISSSTTLADSFSLANVNGNEYVGGLVAYNSSTSTIDNSYATGTVVGTSNKVGGLVGRSRSGATISHSYATGNVTGVNDVGGLVGDNYSSASISDSYATGIVAGATNVGGLVGYNFSSTIINSYATGAATASAQSAGGLVGNNLAGSITNSFATGIANAPSNKGGLIGVYTPGTLTNNWWYNATNTVDVGDDGDVANITKAAAASDFYGSGAGTGGAVYTGASAWNFTEGAGFWNSFSGANPHLDYEWATSITNALQLQNMNLNLAANYTLANNIDASSTVNWNAGAGFNPVGNATTNFTGDFNGNNYTISNLFINRAATTYVGLFGYTVGSTIQNVGLTNVNITGNGRTGGLAGRLYTSSSIDNSYVTGSVSGNHHMVGGLVGSLGYSSVDNSYSTATVSSTRGNVGGLVGYSYRGTIDNSYATGSVDGEWENGGLIGTAGGRTTVSGSYATGNVTSSNNTAGGLVGFLRYLSTIDNSYATGDVDSTGLKAGGLVGYSIMTSSIDNSYATGAVSGSGRVGGLVGQNDDSSISHSFATGVASSAGTKGGLVGQYDSGALTNNWWYNDTNTVDIGDDGNIDDEQIAKATDESDFYSSLHPVYNGDSPWDFDSTLDPYLDSLPRLQWENFGTPAFDVLPATENIILGFNPLEVSAETQSILNPSYLGSLFLGLSSKNVLLDPLGSLLEGSPSANQIKKSGGNVELI